MTRVTEPLRGEFTGVLDPSLRLSQTPRAPAPLLASLLFLISPVLRAQSALQTGQEIYRAACAACHGYDGRGADRSQVGFEQPLPDFSDCNFNSRERLSDWRAVVHDGGPARGFSPIMPAFGEALTKEQIETVVQYLRRFCTDRDWPPGEMNLPRPLITSKAFPEDESVITTAVNTRAGSAVSTRLVYEHRLSAADQVEAVVPLTFRRPAGQAWIGGFGDIALSYKRVLAHSPARGAILSAAGELVLPTGNSQRGLGKGVTVFEPYLAYGQLLPKESFFQFQGGFELPTHTDDAARATFLRFVAGHDFSQRGGLGRLWVPMVEFLADRDLVSGAATSWDAVPQLHFTLSRRQHIRANFGVRLPVNHTAGRPIQILFYLLWDRFDGGLREGW